METTLTAPLGIIAAALHLSPRVTYRCCTGLDPRAPDPAILLDLRKVCWAFGCDRRTLRLLIDGEDTLLTPTAAAARMGISYTTFRNNRPDIRPAVCRGHGAGKWNFRRFRASYIDALARAEAAKRPAAGAATSHNAGRA